MMAAPGITPPKPQPIPARLRVGHFRFLCRLSRLAPDHRAHCRFSRDGGSIVSGLGLWK